MAAHPHAHHHGAHERGAAREGQRRTLTFVLILTGVFMLVEIIGGVLSNSLALLADAGHMFTDVAALALSLGAMILARRPPSPAKTYGYVRLEILAALVNGAALLVIALFITWEAWERLNEPVTVNAPVLMGVAGGGLLVNITSAWVLRRQAGDSLNVRGAYLHVLGDLLGSVGALVAGGVILFTGWSPADPLISVLIAALILVSAWRLVRESTDVLLEAAPAHVDVDELRAALGSIPGLHDVHDLHVWTLTSGFVALSGHGVIEDPARHGEVLAAIQDRLQRSGIEHTTFQLEPRELVQIPPRPRERA